MNYLCFNNKFYQEDQAVFGMNRAIKYGDGLFETIRIKEGKLCFLDDHFNRLKRGLSALNLSLSDKQLEEVKMCLVQLLIKNEVEKDGRARLTVFRDGSGTYLPETNQAAYFIEASSMNAEDVSFNKSGLSIDICTTVIINPSQFTAIKSLNANLYIQAAIEAKKENKDDLILLNQAERLVEASSSNLFIVKGKTLYTTPLEEGCLDGIMRQKVLEAASIINLKVKMIPLKQEALILADEVFLTNSINKIKWVGSFRKKRYFNRISAQLNNLIE